MKKLLLILLLVPTAATAQDAFEVERVCLGAADRNAMVLEADGQYFVVRTYDYSPRTDDEVIHLGGAWTAGNSRMTVYRRGVRKNVDVKVLDRVQFGYSGYNGASMLCKKISTGDI